MQWIWYILSINAVLVIATLVTVFTTEQFKRQSYPKRLMGILALSLFGVFICILVLFNGDTKNEVP